MDMVLKRVLLGFSGGIDSCHAAKALSDQGYEVTALTLDMTGDGEMTEHARREAENMGLPFRMADVREEFRRQVTDYFLSGYAAGRTPAPCTVCNGKIKWKFLYDIARSEGYDHIATGHYFKIARHDGRYYVSRAVDRSKDQSYYLWPLSQQILSITLTPMGDVIKRDIMGNTACKGSPKESMGICFLRGEKCGDFLRSHLGDSIREGDITDKNGIVVGRHEGYPLYTTGQKRGQGIPCDRCVTAVDAADNRIVVGKDSDLYFHNLLVSEYALTDPGEVTGYGDITVVIRGIGCNPEGFCTVAETGGLLKIYLDAPAWAPAEGQPVVLYRGDRVVGGGYLCGYF